MNITELEQYNLAESAKYKDKLSPSIWNGHEKLTNGVKELIMVGLDEYCQALGLTESQIHDVLVAGKMAGYDYSTTDTIDVVVVAELNSDPIFREMFNESRYSFNRQHSIKVDSHYVKFYVQPSDEPLVSRGAYSVLSEQWVCVPVRRNVLANDTVVMLKESEQRAQPVRPIVKKKTQIVEAKKPTVYGYKKVNESTKQLNEFIHSFKINIKRPSRIILENNEDIKTIYLEHIKQSVLKWLWENGEKIKGDISNFYGEENLYGKLVIHYAAKANLLESKYDINDILPELEDLYDGTQTPSIGKAYDIVTIVIREAVGKIIISSEENKTITSISNNVATTSSGDFIQLGNVNLGGIEHTRTYFLPANTSDGIWMMLRLKCKHTDDENLFLNDWQINKSSDSPRKKYAEIFKNLKEVTLTPDGVSQNTKMFLSEQDPLDPEEVLADFIDFCSRSLELSKTPDFRIRRDPQWSIRNKTFGKFNNVTGILEVSIANRHLMDTLRTVAHELTHQRQSELAHMPDGAGDTGSDHENEANAIAGILMREYGKAHPELFGGGEELSEATGYIPTRAEANDPRFKMALTRDVRPGAVGKNANKLMLNTDSQGHPQIANPNGTFKQSKK